MTVSRNIRIHQCSCSRFRGCGRNGKNNIQTTGKAIQLRLHGIRFLSEHLDLLEHRATTSAGKPVLILRVEAEKNFRPSFGNLGILQL